MSLLLLGAVLACTLAGLAMRVGALEPVPVRVVLGGLALDTTIENRICLQRVLHRPCRQPTYTLRVSLDAPGGTRYYRLARLPISERFVFYP